MLRWSCVVQVYLSEGYLEDLSKTAAWENWQTVADVSCAEPAQDPRLPTLCI